MQTNNKLRKAIYAVYNSLCDHEIIYPKERWRLIEIIEAALAEPVKNCDVGTAEEQEKRFHDFCRARHLPRMEVSSYCAYKCPLEGDTCCELQWAQMPYVEKEGGAK